MFLLKTIDALGVGMVLGSEGAGQSEALTAAQLSLVLPH